MASFEIPAGIFLNSCGARRGCAMGIPKVSFGTIKLSQTAGLFDSLSVLSHTYQNIPEPRNMESFGQNYGFILYR